MTKPPRRDNAYYEQQLKSRHPGLHADYLAGKYPTLANALIAAGLKKKRTRLQELQNAWTKSAATEKREFLRWIKGAASAAPSAPLPGPVAVDRLLLPWAKVRIREIMSRRRLRMGDTMAELGLNRGNGSLGLALNQNRRLQPAVIVVLKKWIGTNKHA